MSKILFVEGVYGHCLCSVKKYTSIFAIYQIGLEISQGIQAPVSNFYQACAIITCLVIW